MLSTSPITNPATALASLLRLLFFILVSLSSLLYRVVHRVRRLSWFQAYSEQKNAATQNQTGLPRNSSRGRHRRQ
jgi:uncharacterized protein YpmS